MDMSANIKAFLDMLAISEIGAKLLAASDNGYNVVVGSTPTLPSLFHSYADHPRQLIDLGNGLKSTAAGRYQILARYFDAYKASLGLPDFGHDSQDRIAFQMIHECHAIPMIEAGDFDGAVKACSSRWASLPGAGYGQHVNDMDALRAAYIQAGGTLS